MTLGDVKYIPGLVFAIAVMVAVFGAVWGGLVWLVVSQPAVLLIIPVLLGAAWVYIRFDEATHPNRVKYHKP